MQMTIYPLGPLDWGAEDTLHKQHCLEVLLASDHHPLKAGPNWSWLCQTTLKAQSQHNLHGVLQ